MAVAFLLALIGTFPLRMLFASVGAGELGLSARGLHGPIWSGVAEDMQAGPVRIGTVDVMLSPLPLLLGKARFDLSRRAGEADDLSGALVLGIATRGVDAMTGSFPFGGALAPLMVSAVEMQDVSIAFSRAGCVRAEGRMRARVMPGLALANGLSGAIRCDGADLLIPLVSQSGVERMDVRVDSSGQYRATLIGFGAQAIRIDGSL